MAKHPEGTHEVHREVTREVTVKHDPFHTTIEDAPDVKEEGIPLSQKTQVEQAAGRAMLEQYTAPPEETPTSKA